MSPRKRVVGSGRLLWLFVPVAWAVACGDSTEDCNETQTCITPNAGEGGEANGGAAGTSRGGTSGNGGRGGASSGDSGSSGSGGAQGGVAGSGASGAAGAGMGGDDGGDAPTVVSVTLDGSDATEDVDVYAELVIEFSEAISEDTLTTDSVHVNVGGHEILGEVTVDDATHAIFTPLERYYLTAEHTLTVTTDVTDTGGTALEEDYELAFTVRDGVWTHAVSQPPEPLPNTDPQMKAAMGVDGQGNVLVAWAERPSSFYARWYRQGSGWEAVQPLSTSLSICPVYCVPVHVKVNRNGDAIVATASGSNVSAYQYRNGAWGPVMPLEVGETPPGLTGIGISDNGEAHVMTARSMGASTGALITRHTTTTGSWRPVDETAGGTVPSSAPKLAFDANGNGIAVWGVSPNPMVFSRYDQATGTWSPRTPIPRTATGGTAQFAVALRPEGDGVVAWVNQEPNNDLVVKAVTYSGAGFADVDPTLVSNAADEAANGPVLAFDGSDFVVGWSVFGDANPNSAWTARIRNGTVSDRRQISDNNGRYAPPSLGADASGNTLAVVRVPLADSDEEPWTTRYRRTAATWPATPTRLLAVVENRDDPAPALVVAPNGVAATAISYRINEMFEFETSVLLFQ